MIGFGGREGDVSYLRLSWRNQLLFCLKFEIVESAPFVESNRYDPAQREKAHDEKPKCAEIGVEPGDYAPEPTSEMKVLAQQPESLNASDNQRDND